MFPAFGSVGDFIATIGPIIELKKKKNTLNDAVGASKQ